MSGTTRARFKALTVMAVTLLATLAMIASLTTSASAAGTAEPATDADEAQTLLEQMLVAVGGPEQLDQIRSVAMTANGTRWILDEGAEPGSGHGAPGRYGLDLAFDLSGHRFRLDYAIDSSRFGERQISELVDGTGGYLIGQDSVIAPPGQSAMGNDRLVSVVTHQLLMNPHLLLQAARDGVYEIELGRPVRVGRNRHDVLVLKRDGASPLHLFVSRSSRLVTKLTTVENDPLRRDVELEVQFRRWRSVDEDLRVPRRVRIYYDRELIQDEFRNTIEVNGDLDQSRLQPPAGLTPVSDPVLARRGLNSHQHLQSFAALGFPLDGLQLTVRSTELAPGVHWLTGGSHHSLLVEHDDGLVLVDAPRTHHRARAILAHVEANFPGRQITHMVQSHHHADHSAGARTIVATGADLVIHESASQFWREILRAPSTVVPDGLALAPTDVDIVRVPDGSFTRVGRGDNAVEMHSFAQNHADDLVLVVAGGVAFIVDFVNPFPGAPVTPELQVVLDVIVDRGLEVNTLAGGHGAFIPVSS